MTDGRAGRPRVVVVGGGFGGLEAARSLRGAAVNVTLVDRRNHHLFQPLLYQVATAALSPADIASPIRHVLRKAANVEVVMGNVVDVDVPGRSVLLADGEQLDYDFLVLAPGAVDRYFGHDEWAPDAPGLKSIEDALEIRRRFLTAFEAAEREEDPRARRAMLTAVVVGGGATGVEMAGAMAEMARHSLVRDFRRIDPSTARIILVEGGPRVLPAYDPSLSAHAEDDLRRRGVEVRTGAMVSSIQDGAVRVGEDEVIPARTVVWAAGVAGAPLGAKLGAPLDRIGRVIVEPDMTLPDHPEIFVIGDLAAAPDGAGGFLPGLAPVAQQQGRWIAEGIRRSLDGRRPRPFVYRDRGKMATIGRAAAVAEIGKVKLRGFVAWLTWLFVHVLFLIGFRNRVFVMLEWAWAYLTWQRGARLITGRAVKSGRGIEGP
jgi:NADH dehydrogenase